MQICISSYYHFFLRTFKIVGELNLLMQINWVEVFLFAFCLVLLGLSFLHFLEAENLRAENAALSEELAQTNLELEEVRDSVTFERNRIDGLKLELEKKDVELAEARADIRALSAELNATKNRVEELEQDFEQFQQEYIELQSQYEEKAEEYEQLLSEIGEFEADLQEKMYWYTANSDFGGEAKGFLSRVRSRCIDGDTLNMPCVAVMLEQKGFSYVSEGNDYIKSLEEFEDEDGGDCEDWSIFVKAIINEMVEEEGVEELLVADAGEDGHFVVYTDDNIEYYYRILPLPNCLQEILLV